jgi:hypothetical protein
VGNVVAIPKHVDVVEFERPPGLPATCSDGELVEAVKASICGASYKEVAELLHVPEFSAKYWISSKEWTAIKQAVLPELKGFLHTDLCGIRSSILQKLGERVRFGDPQYNQMGEPVLNAEGEQVFRPIKAKDLSIMMVQVSGVLHDIEVEIGVITDEDDNISLKALQKALQRAAREDIQDITGSAQRLS